MKVINYNILNFENIMFYKKRNNNDFFFSQYKLVLFFKKIYHDFLNPIRNSYLQKYNIIYGYSQIIKLLELPLNFSNFDNGNKFLWRFNSLLVNSIFNKKYKNYIQYCDIGLKQNFNILMPYYLKSAIVNSFNKNLY
jgi:hypothetical protein